MWPRLTSWSITAYSFALPFSLKISIIATSPSSFPLLVRPEWWFLPLFDFERQNLSEGHMEFTSGMWWAEDLNKNLHLSWCHYLTSEPVLLLPLKNVSSMSLLGWITELYDTRCDILSLFNLTLDIFFTIFHPQIWLSRHVHILDRTLFLVRACFYWIL